jgi:hypothetical protein
LSDQSIFPAWQKKLAEQAANPAAPQSSEAIAETPSPLLSFFVRWTWPIAIGVVALAAVVVFWSQPDIDDEPPLSPDLPEWFQPAYRIRKNRAIIFGVSAPQLAVPQVNKDVGVKYSPEWLEEHFTHYMQVNAFVFIKAKIVYPCDGKIMEGVKVILGPRIDEDLSLICTLAPEGLPENMYVQHRFLRDRANGPPPPSRDD